MKFNSFIYIPLISYEDTRINNIDDLFREYINISLNNIYNGPERYREKNKNANFYYGIILILSINNLWFKYMI